MASKSHWDTVYDSNTEIKPNWKPYSYDELSLEKMLLNEIDRFNPKTVLEIGCGSSAWLPYLAKLRNLQVCGMDYSEDGCKLARKRLEIENVPGTVFCQDLFKANSEEIGQYDFVYSLGVAEHFSNLDDVLFHLSKFVKPGGVLLTEVPNLKSIHGFLSWIYQPKQLMKHKLLGKKDLLSAYNKLGMENLRAEHIGLFSFSIVAWGFNSRFPRLDRFILPTIRIIIMVTDKITIQIKTFKGNSLTSPFLYAVGVK